MNVTSLRHLSVILIEKPRCRLFANAEGALSFYNPAIFTYSRGISIDMKHLKNQIKAAVLRSLNQGNCYHTFKASMYVILLKEYISTEYQRKVLSGAGFCFRFFERCKYIIDSIAYYFGCYAFDPSMRLQYLVNKKFSQLPDNIREQFIDINHYFLNLRRIVPLPTSERDVLRMHFITPRTSLQTEFTNGLTPEQIILNIGRSRSESHYTADISEGMISLDEEKSQTYAEEVKTRNEQLQKTIAAVVRQAQNQQGSNEAINHINAEDLANAIIN